MLTSVKQFVIQSTVGFMNLTLSNKVTMKSGPHSRVLAEFLSLSG